MWQGSITQSSKSYGATTGKPGRASNHIPSTVSNAVHGHCKRKLAVRTIKEKRPSNGLRAVNVILAGMGPRVHRICQNHYFGLSSCNSISPELWGGGAPDLSNGGRGTSDALTMMMWERRGRGGEHTARFEFFFI